MAIECTEKEQNENDIDGASPLGEENMAHADGRLHALLGYFKNLHSVAIPKTSADNPFVIRAQNPRYPKVMVINAPLIGTLEAANSDGRIFQNALQWAEAARCDAVILTGPVIWFPTEKYGSQRPTKVQVVSVHVDADLIAKSYPPRVLESLGGAEEIRRQQRPLFLTTTVYLEHLMRIFARLLRDNAGRLLFSGPILMVLGDMEENIANYYANEQIRIAVFEERRRARSHIRRLRQTARLARRFDSFDPDDLSPAKKAAWDKECGEFGIPFSELGGLDIAALEDEISQWERYSAYYALMGNADPEFVQQLMPQMKRYMAACFSSAAPTITVVGIGDTFFRMGSHLVEVVSDKSGNNIRGGFAGKLRHGLYSYVKGHEGTSVVDVMLGAGLNPYLTELFVTHRVRAYADTLDDVRMSQVYQLPACIDAALYREIVRGMVRAKDDLTRLASFANQESGAVILSRDEESAIPKTEYLGSAFLTNAGIFSSMDALENAVSGRDGRSQMMYHYKEGCTHYGAAHIARYPAPADPDRRYVKYHYQVVFEMLYKNRVPIVGYENDGDIQQWYNYAVHREGNFEHKTPEEILVMLDDLGPARKGRKKMLEALILEQTILGGVIQPQDQIVGYVESLRRHFPFFRELVLRAASCGIEHEGRLGILTIGQGNHNDHTWKHSDVRFDEGRWTREKLLLELIVAYPELARVLPEAICAPNLDGLGEARGLFGVRVREIAVSHKNGRESARKGSAYRRPYQYGLYMLHKQGTSKTKDNMRGMVEGFSWLGTASQYESGRFTVNLGGDDHLGGMAVTRSAFHIKTGGQMFEGQFGRRLRFPEQNIFSAVWGVPAGGPAWGPLVFIPIDYRAVRKYADKPCDLSPQLFDNSFQPVYQRTA